MSRPACAPLSHAAYLGRDYIPELDSLRAFSVLLVVSAHVYDADRLWWRWLAGGQGVTIFFLLSGYLITTLALHEEDRRGAVSLAAFYVRRGLRILPLYYFTLTLYAVLLLGLGVHPHRAAAFRDALPAYLLYYQEIPFFSRMLAAGEPLPFFQSWSLGVEEKFYLLWPLIAFVLWRGRPARRRGGTVLLTAALLLGPAIVVGLAPPLRLLVRCLISYGAILAGCLLALLLHDRRWFACLRPLGRHGTSVACGFLALHFGRPWLPECPLPFGWEILYILAGAVFLATVLLGEGPVQWLLRRPALVAVGKLSYAIYLVHTLSIAVAYKAIPSASESVAASVLAYVLACILSTAAAWVLARVLERPCIQLGRRWSRHLLERGSAPKRAAAVAA